MRDFKGMKRQRSRNRNGGSGGGGGGSGGKPQHNTNRAFDSNGPEGVKVRGAAQHVYEKYQQLARDAQTAGDRVLAENYLQHAEHYFRLMRAMQPQRSLSDIIGRDQFVSGYDIDFEDETGSGEGNEADSEPDPAEAADGSDRQPRYDARREDYRQGETRARDDQARQDRPQNDRFQNDRSQNDRVQTDRYQNDRSQNERASGERPVADRATADRPPSSDRPRDDRTNRAARDDRLRFNREDRPVRTDRDPLGVIEPEATPLTPSMAPAADAPMLRADDGEISHAPAFLQVRPAEAERPPPSPPTKRPPPPTPSSRSPPSRSAPPLCGILATLNGR